MLISDQVANQMPHGHGHRFRRLGEVSVKGSSTPIGIIEVYDQDPLEVRDLKERIEPIVSEGIDLFKAGHLDAAVANFKKAQDIFPQDLPLRLLINSARNALEQGPSVKGAALLDFRTK
jgi:hypothetical protein